MLPVEAIEESRYLPAEEWESAYPGIDITGISLADEGYYVRYQHENLNYFFGPIETLDEAREHLRESWSMSGTELITKRPTLSTSEVDVVKFSLDDAVWGGAATEAADRGGRHRVWVARKVPAARRKSPGSAGALGGQEQQRHPGCA